MQTVSEIPGITTRLIERYRLPLNESGRINLLLEEALVNVISYAYPPGQEDDIRLVAQYDDIDGALTLEISDTGMPFDPTAAPEPDINAPAEARRTGGLGIHLVRALSDDLQYYRSAERNHLVIKFFISHS